MLQSLYSLLQKKVYYMYLFIRNFFSSIFLIASFAYGDIVWEENFNDPAIDQKGATGSNTGATTDMTGITKWSIDVTGAALTATSDWFRVQNGLFEARDTDGDAVWESETIDITGLSDVNFTLEASEIGDIEGGNTINTDYMDVYYSLNGGTFQRIPNWNNLGSTDHTLLGDTPADADWGTTTVSQSIINGNSSLKIRVVMKDSAGDEYLRIDNVKVETSTTVPVTIAYVYPEVYGESLEVAFSTASETANIGFNIYAIKDKVWIKLNDELIDGALDSFEPKMYNFSIDFDEEIKFNKIGIAGVDITGKEDRHGPFKVGKVRGKKTALRPVNWKKVRQQVKAERKSRKAKKKARKAVRKETRQILKNENVIFKVSNNARYRVTHQELLELGINLQGIKTNRIALSFKGAGIARHIEETRNGKWTDNSALTFIGKKPNVTDALYVKENHYRLSLRKKLVIESGEIEPLTVKKTVVEKNLKYAYTMPLDDPFYEGFFYTVNADNTASYSSHFDLPTISQTGSATLNIYAAVTTEGSHRMSISLNDTHIKDTTASNRTPWIITTEIENSLLQESDNTLTFTLYGENDGMDIVAYDKLAIQSHMQEEIPAQSPEILREEKLSKKSLKVKKRTNYLIIAHPLFMNETLDEYVTHRQSEGWKIKVVSVKDIYTAYSDGMAIPEAITQYIKDATDRGVHHVQLIGASNYDYHDYLGLGSVSFIPSLYTLTNRFISYTPSDASYVMGENNLPRVAIGRWPVRTVEEFRNVIDKTLSWQSDYQNALLIADQTDSKGNVFTSQMNKMEEKMKVNGYLSKSVYLDRYNETLGEEGITAAREDIAQNMMSGVSIISYSGHGSPTQWSPSGLLQQSDIKDIDTGSVAPLALPFSCMATYADSPMNDTMTHQLSNSRNGAVAIYGATTYSTYANNGMMIGQVFERLTQGETLGEAIMQSKHEIGSNYSDVIKNGNLLGDVTLKIK